MVEVDILVVSYVVAAFVFSMVGYCVVIPYFAARKIQQGLSSEFGKKMIKNFMAQVRDIMKDPANRKEVIDTCGMMFLEILDSEIEVDQEDGSKVKIPTMHYIGANLASQFTTYMQKRIGGEKGNISKEMKGLQNELLLQAVPEKYRGVASMVLPIASKYPAVMSMIQAFGMQQIQNQGNGGHPPSNGGGSALTYK